MCKTTINHEEMSLSLQQLEAMTHCIYDSLTQWNKLIEQKELDELISEFKQAEIHAADLSGQLQTIQAKLEKSRVSATTVSVTEF
ncbi:hypothetical protein ACTWQL_16070 [Pseudalkalibacillus sp. R45]|uniref:hypothetical protein n=1 Tax=Pseudalkalibacillus sp. R45 TaxID=3457433 RepID=UPI003FCD810B